MGGLELREPGRQLRGGAAGSGAAAEGWLRGTARLAEGRAGVS